MLSSFLGLFVGKKIERSSLLDNSLLRGICDLLFSLPYHLLPLNLGDSIVEA